jgi:hypothetical protein
MRCAFGKRDAMKSIRECQYRQELDFETLVCTRGLAAEMPPLRVACRQRHF